MRIDREVIEPPRPGQAAIGPPPNRVAIERRGIGQAVTDPPPNQAVIDPPPNRAAIDLPPIVLPRVRAEIASEITTCPDSLNPEATAPLAVAEEDITGARPRPVTRAGPVAWEAVPVVAAPGAEAGGGKDIA